MALIHGKNGMANFNSTDLGEAVNWSLDNTIAMADTTAFQDTGDATCAAGISSWTATVEAFHTDGGPRATKGQSATLDLELANGSDKYTGTAICTGRSVATNVGDMVRITYTFQFTGTVTEPS